MIKNFDKKILFSICGIILIFLLVFTIYRENQVMYTNVDSLSNKKIGWGIKREKDHKRPDVGKENAELMEKYDGIYIGNEEKKYIYLTFDEGYEAGYTEQILDVLKDYIFYYSTLSKYSRRFSKKDDKRRAYSRKSYT